MSYWLNPDTGQYEYGGPSAGGGMGMGGIGAGIGGILGGILGMGQNNNPASAGMPYLGQIGSTITPYYQPYINAGNSAMGYMQNTLLPQYQKMFQNPGQFMNQMGQSFQQSPGYQFQVNQALGAANRAAAAGGTLGTPMEQQQIAGTVNGLANQDYYNWMNHAQNMLGMGLNGASGLSQNMFDTGFNASNSLANNLAQALSAQAQMAYAGQNQQNQSKSGLLGDIAGGVGSILGSGLLGGSGMGGLGVGSLIGSIV